MKNYRQHMKKYIEMLLQEAIVLVVGDLRHIIFFQVVKDIIIADIVLLMLPEKLRLKL